MLLFIWNNELYGLLTMMLAQEGKKEFFEKNNRVALAFSSGVDSTYLLYAAIKYGAQVRAYYVKSAFQPQFELDDAKKMAKHLNADMKIIEKDVLACEAVTDNPANRCYFCKQQIFSTIAENAKADGFEVIIDGTNALMMPETDLE